MTSVLLAGCLGGVGSRDRGGTGGHPVGEQHMLNLAGAYDPALDPACPFDDGCLPHGIEPGDTVGGASALLTVERLAGDGGDGGEPQARDPNAPPPVPPDDARPAEVHITPFDAVETYTVPLGPDGRAVVSFVTDVPLRVTARVTARGWLVDDACDRLEVDGPPRQARLDGDRSMSLDYGALCRRPLPPDVTLTETGTVDREFHAGWSWPVEGQAMESYVVEMDLRPVAVRGLVPLPAGVGNLTAVLRDGRGRTVANASDVAVAPVIEGATFFAWSATKVPTHALGTWTFTVDGTGMAEYTFRVRVRY